PPLPSSVLGGVSPRPSPFFIFQGAILDPIPGRTVWHDFRFIDNARRGHAQWLENVMLQEVPKVLPGHTANKDTQRHITQIAITPSGSGRICRRDRLDESEKLLFAIVFSKIESIRIVSKSGCMAQE